MIDLHCHTTASDGVISPYNIIIQAAKEGVAVMAIADHDTVDGLEQAAQAAKDAGVRFIPAIELSVAYPKGYFHLLGYGIRYENRDFRKKLEQLRIVREERVLRMVERLNMAGVHIKHEDVQKELNGSAPGKPHVARALVKKGYAGNVQDAMKTYLNLGAPGYVPKENLSQEAAIELIGSVGGLSVLAHPKSLRAENPEEYDQLIKRFVSQGGVGIEVYASIHDERDVKMFNEIAKRYDLIVTGGSDYHGDNGGQLGYYGSRTIPESCSLQLLQLTNA
jgi:predicted metal-dependent phosphoesterase TrpH